MVQILNFNKYLIKMVKYGFKAIPAFENIWYTVTNLTDARKKTIFMLCNLLQITVCLSLGTQRQFPIHTGEQMQV